MEYSNALVVCREDSTDLSLLCFRYYGGVRRNVGMQGNTGLGVVIHGRIRMRQLRLPVDLSLLSLVLGGQ